MDKKKPAKKRVRTLKELEKAEAKINAEIEKERKLRIQKSADTILKRIGSIKETSDAIKPYIEFTQKTQAEIKAEQEKILEMKVEAVKKIHERYKKDPDKDKLPENIQKLLE